MDARRREESDAVRKRSGWAGVVAALISLTVTADYREHPEAQAWLERVVARHDLSADEVRGLLASAQRQPAILDAIARPVERDRKSTRLNSSHVAISYAVFCLQKKTLR